MSDSILDDLDGEEKELPKRFLRLFRPAEHAHGRHKDGPKKGSSWIEHAPPTEALAAEHLRGAIHLGVFPLHRDGACFFGAIDVDDYALDHAALAARIATLKLPLLLCRSKSGGAHLYAFSARGFHAPELRERLSDYAAALGYGNVEVFPKQDAIGPDDDGNWLNLPYCDGARHAIAPDGRALALDEFLTEAEALANRAASELVAVDKTELLRGLLLKVWTEGRRDNLATVVTDILLKKCGWIPEACDELIGGLPDGQTFQKGEARFRAWHNKKPMRGIPKMREIAPEIAAEFLRAVGLDEERGPEWLRRDGSGRLLLDEENIRLCLVHDPELTEFVEYDEFKAELRLLRAIPGTTLDVPREWTEADTVELAMHLQRSAMPRAGREKVESVIDAYAKATASRHPLRECLVALRWDETPRVAGFLEEYFGAKDLGQPTEYVAAAGRAWLISAVARVMRPGCQADYTLVFEGAQGLQKSKALRALAGEAYFSDNLPPDLGSKDAQVHLRGKWIIELPELAQFRRSEIETVKAFLTRREDRFRPPFGRREVTCPRQCVFAGSTNETEYLVDTTGNRRYWPIKVASMIDAEAIARDRDQLWAEAMVLFRAGERWYLAPEIEALAALETEQRLKEDDPWQPIVAEIVTGPMRQFDHLAPGEVLFELLEKFVLPVTVRVGDDFRTEDGKTRATDHTTGNARRVATCMRRLGWEHHKGHRTRGQLYRRPRVDPMTPVGDGPGRRRNDEM